MARVIATLIPFRDRKAPWIKDSSLAINAAIESLDDIIISMLNCMLGQSRDADTGLLKNYLDGEGGESAAWAFGDTAGTSLVTSAVYRLAVLQPEVFMKAQYISWANRNLQAVAEHVYANGRVGPVAQINGVPAKDAMSSTSEGQSMALLLYAARRDFLMSQGWVNRMLMQL
jgi:hypothetical protein